MEELPKHLSSHHLCPQAIKLKWFSSFPYTGIVSNQKEFFPDAIFMWPPSPTTLCKIPTPNSLRKGQRESDFVSVMTWEVGTEEDTLISPLSFCSLISPFRLPKPAFFPTKLH